MHTANMGTVISATRSICLNDESPILAAGYAGNSGRERGNQGSRTNTMTNDLRG
jgi:hypothetical protein